MAAKTVLSKIQYNDCFQLQSIQLAKFGILISHKTIILLKLNTIVKTKNNAQHYKFEDYVINI